jgi:hypothetical protein
MKTTLVDTVHVIFEICILCLTGHFVKITWSRRSKVNVCCQEVYFHNYVRFSTKRELSVRNVN